MTSRVQKGGPIFRPVVKSRTRPPIGDARQVSLPVDSLRGHAHGTTLAPASSASMLPPADIPSRTVPHSGGPSANSQTIHPNADRPSSAYPSCPPTLAIVNSYSTMSSPASAVPRSVNSPVPPMIVHHTTTLAGKSSALTSSSSSITGAPPSRAELGSDGSEYPITTTTHRGAPQHILHHSGTENISSLPNAVAPVKPQRTTTRSNKAALPPDVDQHGDPEADEQNGAVPAVTKTKRRKLSHDDAAGTAKGPSRRKRKAVTGPDTDTEGNNQGAVNKRRRASSGTPRPRGSQAPSLTPFDADADPGAEIDPTVVTMASLCNDTGFGRVSRKAAEILTNHAAWKVQSKEKRARMKALMELKKYGRDEEGESDDANNNASTSGVVDTSRSAIPGPSGAPQAPTSISVMDDPGDGFDYTQDMATSRFNVQVRIGPNGETIIDEESLVVDRMEAEDTESYTHVVESDNTKFVNSGSYGKRFRGSRWSAEETESFYDALSQYGENYELIAYVLPGRDRKSCKNKFKAEDRKNPARINYCLNHSIPVDMTTLSRMTGKDFSGPVPEIRTPVTQPTVKNSTSVNETAKIPPADSVKKRGRNRNKPSDDGVVVVGEVGDFEDP